MWPKPFEKVLLNVLDFKNYVEQNFDSLPKNFPPRGYIMKRVELLPISVELKISKAIHVTGRTGMDGIRDASGFRPGENAEGKNGLQFLWWSLAVDNDDILSAQHRFLKALLPHMTPEEVKNHPKFLKQFTTSPAFQPGSRYGNFKFTFPLQRLFQKYKEQFCNGMEPMLRVYKTVVYKQEIMQVMVIHSPNVHYFDECPELPGVARKGSLMWRPRAISNICNLKLLIHEDSVEVKKKKGKKGKYYYMWEHGALAFHIPPGETLRFELDELINSLSACDKLKPVLCRDGVTYEEAKTIVAELKRGGKQDKDSGNNHESE